LTAARYGTRARIWSRSSPAKRSTGCAPYDEIAAAVGKTAAAVRQIAHRAKEHVAARRPRMPVTRSEQEDVVERFLLAIRGGDLQDLLDVLAPDVVAIADGGGLAPAARKPLVGRDRVARALLVLAKNAPRAEISTLWLNGALGVRVDLDGEVGAMSLSIENGRITGIYALANPHKLAGLRQETVLSRGS
jgi:RNA polymerase sigma-70 factor (ECF subfamily)